MSGPGPADRWAAVDAYLEDHLLVPDAALDQVQEASEAAGLPPIAVSPLQGKLLHLLARVLGARRVLEVGTLGGYSTTWLARALPSSGRLVSLELDPRHAAVAGDNLRRAGLAERVEIRVGPALASLEALAAEHAGDRPFDLVFLDADKPANADYLVRALPLTRPGGVIVVDNIVRAGRIVDAGDTDPAVAGTRRFFEVIRGLPGLDATALQTVGVKGHDGFVLAVVD